MARNNPSKAQLVQTLVFYDGPQVALFETHPNRLKMLAVAVEGLNRRNKFFACEVLDKAFRAYKNGRLDLNFLFRYSMGRRLFTFSWSEMDGDGWVFLSKATQREIANDKYYPERGFFEEDHTEDWKTSTAPATKRSFGIDGRWDASDFSRFYNKIGDIYAFLSVVEDLKSDDISQSERSELMEALNEPTWRGGGSYVGFYADIGVKSDIIRPLRISGISYNSPGYIEMEGRSSVFMDLDDSLNQFYVEAKSLGSIYSRLNKVLFDEGLRSADKNASFSSETVEGYARTLALQLAQGLGIKDIETLYGGCRANTVIFSKLLLSYFRRLRDLSIFEKEGRITISRD